MVKSLRQNIGKKLTSALSTHHIFPIETTKPRKDKLLSMLNTDQISQEEVDRECELVREELYDARQTR